MTPLAEPASSPAAEPGLLVAVTGGVGAGKTRLVTAFVATQLAAGQRVEGVLAPAGERSASETGAAAYRLQLIGEAGDHPWAQRDETQIPPYRFDAGTTARLHAWAQSLATRPPAPLLVLDEFGKLELRGAGLMPFWSALAATRPGIVLIAVREEHLAEIEKKLGRKFDVRVAAEDPTALAQLRKLSAEFGEWTRISLFGGASGGLEMTAGTALHAARIPLRGLVMSSVQASMMVYAGDGLSEPGRVVWVPFIAAGLKALAPGGSQVRPMTAIVMQGLLFGGTVQALGWNGVALGLAGALVGAWAALQGFFLQYLMLGGKLIQAYDQVVLWLADRWHLGAPGLPWLVTAWALLHAGVAAGAALTAWRLKRPPEAFQRLLVPPSVVPAAQAPRPAWQRRLREFGNWRFWLPLVVVAAVLLGSGHGWQTVAWVVLRFVAVGGVLVALVSLVRPARFAEHLRRRGWWGPAIAFNAAVRRREPRD